MKTTLQRACEAAGRPLTLAEVAALPTTKADLAHEKAEFAEACERAEKYGDQLQERLDSPECNRPELFQDIKASDYTPGGRND